MKTLPGPVIVSVTSLVLLGGSIPGMAVESIAAVGDGAQWWDIVLLLLVFATAVGSAVLPVSAMGHWSGYWKLVAAMPLLVLVAWSSWIVVARLLAPASHQFWLLEIFAWAMLTMIYMATVMIAKRQFEKADNSESS